MANFLTTRGLTLLPVVGGTAERQGSATGSPTNLSPTPVP